MLTATRHHSTWPRDTWSPAKRTRKNEDKNDQEHLADEGKCLVCPHDLSQTQIFNFANKWDGNVTCAFITLNKNLPFYDTFRCTS